MNEQEKEACCESVHKSWAKEADLELLEVVTTCLFSWKAVVKGNGKQIE